MKRVKVVLLTRYCSIGRRQQASLACATRSLSNDD